MKKIKSNQATKKSHRFNIIDVVVFLVILSLFIALFIFIDPLGRNNEQTEKKTVLCVVELKEFYQKQINAIQVDDQVLFNLDGVDIGKVVEIEPKLSYTWDKSDEKGQMVLLQNKGKVTLYVTIEVECSYQDGVGYFLHSQQLLVGKTLGFKFPMLEMNGEVVSIQVEE